MGTSKPSKRLNGTTAAIVAGAIALGMGAIGFSSAADNAVEAEIKADLAKVQAELAADAAKVEAAQAAAKAAAANK